MYGNILIVEDDRKISSLLGVYLRREGFNPLFAYDGAAALELLSEQAPALMILDLMLPTVDGWQVCRKLRESSDLPILILTARGEEAERVLGLSLGADDYVVKPFSPRELVERVKAVLRRTSRQSDGRGEVFESASLRVDTAKRKVTLGGLAVTLTPSEYCLLIALMSAPGRVYSRRQLMRHLYPAGEDVVERVVDVHIGKLRQKLSQAHAGREFIETIRGVGYSFTEGDGS
jgi:DNA-binding response OmpR family regulator